MLRIVIADDCNMVRAWIRRILEQNLGQRTELIAEASDGAEALEFLHRERADLLFSDIEMPHMNGIRLLEIVQKERLCQCVVLMSECAKFEYAREGLRLGAFDYFVKPIEAEKIAYIYRRVGTVIKQRFIQKKDFGEDVVAACILGKKQEIESVIQRYLKRCLKENSSTDSDDLSMARGLRGIQEKVVEKYPWLENLLLEKEEIRTYLMKAQERKTVEKEVSEYLLSLYRFIKEYVPDEVSEIISNTVDYILWHPYEKFSLTDMANMNYVSNTYLSYRFHIEIGRSYIDYVGQYKSDLIRKLLISTDKNVMEIAEQLGFGDYKYMGRFFKKRTGYAPSDYRKIYCI
ncbi:MAG: response regulator [Lachnospiraceae bacterium]|nr:response regulator [Lachnospiraceae bacterium]